jgi:hypothetical protein
MVPDISRYEANPDIPMKYHGNARPPRKNPFMDLLARL